MALLQEITVPLLAVNDTTLTVVDVAFSNSQPVKKGDIILVFETSKTTYEVVAETDGFVQYLCEANRDYEVNEVVARIFTSAVEIVNEPVKAVQQELTPQVQRIENNNASNWTGDTLYSLEAIRLIESLHVDKSAFKGRDFVSRQDVEELKGINGTINNKKTVEPVVAHQPKKATIPIDASKVIVERLSSNKKREIEFLSSVQSSGLISTINVTVNTEAIFVHLNRSLKYFKNSLLPVIIYETARLLQKYPALNGYFTGDGIAFYKEVNVGFAIDIDKGLKVLKIGTAANKALAEIEENIMTLSTSYLDDTLQIDDLTDITFTITDLSSEGVAFFKPLVNMMNSAILGVSAIDDKLQRCTLSCTFDHRVTEGKLVAVFLKELANRLESYRATDHAHAVKDIICYKCSKSLEDELSDVGFVKSITPDGKEGYICQSCLKGF
jgi:pyruvate/2-oxoglutarate dehydrogenase complex dihydrolipoamide acyltransferase (E2) component